MHTERTTVEVTALALLLMTLAAAFADPWVVAAIPLILIAITATQLPKAGEKRAYLQTIYTLLCMVLIAAIMIFALA